MIREVAGHSGLVRVPVLDHIGPNGGLTLSNQKKTWHHDGTLIVSSSGRRPLGIYLKLLQQFGFRIVVRLAV